MSNIVPFGKYKGQPVEALAQDQAYCEWLMSEDWFRARYATIHTLIVNNFAAPHETPEHNALQVLFTDEDWIALFMWTYVGPGWAAERISEALLKTHKACKAAITHKAGVIHEMEHAKSDNPWDIKRLEDNKVELNKIRHSYDARVKWLSIPPGMNVGISDLAFEQRGVDVKFTASILAEEMPEAAEFTVYDSRGLEQELGYVGRYFHLAVECKPSLGDDYPAVLRQMLARDQEDGKGVLFIGRGGYTGSGATFAQVKKIFDTSDIRILTLAQVNGEEIDVEVERG